MPQAILTTCFWLLSFSHLHFGHWSLLLAPGHLLCPFWCFVFSSYLAMWILWPFFTSGEVAHGLIQLSFGYFQGGDFSASQGSLLQGLILVFVRYLSCFSVFPFWACLGKDTWRFKIDWTLVFSPVSGQWQSIPDNTMLGKVICGHDFEK